MPHEAAHDDLGDGLEIGRTAFPSHGGHDHAVDSTGCDGREAGEVRRDIQSKAVPGHPAPDGHADGSDLARAHPDARQPGTSLGGDAEMRQRADQHLFEPAHVPAHVGPQVAQAEDRVAHQLPGPVIRDLTAATDPDHRDGAVGGCSEEARIGTAPERVDGRMLEHEKRVRPAGESTSDQRLLPGERDVVRHTPASRDAKVHAHMLTASPCAASAASRRISDRVGCACTVSRSSLVVASRVRARPASPTSSVTPWPIRWTPRISPWRAPAMSFAMPSVWPAAIALPMAPTGTFPTLIGPRARASASVSPMAATSGWQ